MKSRAASFPAALFLFLMSIGGEGRGEAGNPREVEVRPAAVEILETEPGRIVTAPVIVSNRTDRELRLLEELVLPEGWQPVVPVEIAVPLAPGAEQLRLLAFHVPTGTLSGEYEVIYSVLTEEDFVLRDRLSIPVVVLPAARLELTFETRPELVVAGETYETTLRARNRGNAPMDVEIGVRATPDFPVTGVPEPFNLAPGESRLLRLRVETDAALVRRVRHHLQVRAAGRLPDGTQLSVRETGFVEVVPRVSGITDPYHRIPSHLRVIAAHDNELGGAVQVEVAGSGVLDEEGRQSLDFLLRGPERAGAAGFGFREEYRVRFFDSDWSLQAGDDIFSLSRLTEQYRYARGIGLHLHPEAADYRFGGFMIESHWVEPRLRGTGGYLQRDFSDTVRVGANVYQRSRHELDGLVRDRLYSVETTLWPVPGNRIETEVALGERSGAETASGEAFRVEATGRIQDAVNYSAGIIRAGPDYRGYYHDTESTHGRLLFPIYGSLRGNVFFRQFTSNLDRDPERRSTAPRERVYGSGVRYPFSFGTSVSLDFQNLDRKDLLDDPRFDFEEQSVRAGLGQRFRRWNVQTYAERGILDDRLRDESRDTERYSAYVTFRPTQRQSYSASTRVGHTRFMAEPQRRRDAGVTGQWLVGRQTSLRAGYSRHTFQADDESRTFHSAHAGVIHHLANGHSVEVSGRWAEEAGEGDERVSAYAAYTIPWGMPAGRRRGIGTIEGSVYNAVDGGRPLAGAVVTANGVTAVTDSRGRYRFPGLAPGLYTLRIEQQSIGTLRTTMEPLPILVEVHEGQTVEVPIAIVPTANVVGQVRVYHNGNNGNGIELGAVIGSGNGSGNGDPGYPDEGGPVGLANVTVIIRNGGGSRGTVTDSAGRFAFEQLRPGEWTIAVCESALPAHHYFDRDQVRISLEPGTTGEVHIRVHPRERRIQFIDEGELR